MAKILLFDIEATNLSANFGFMLSFGYKWLGEKTPRVISISRFKEAFGRNCTNDKELCKTITPILAEADQWVTWYGLRFDVPFIRTRLLLNSLAPIPDKPHVDGWRIAKYRLKFTSNRLGTVSRALPLDEGEVKRYKTPLENHHWIRGAAGHRPSLRYIDQHCLADVDVLEQAYLKLRPFGSQLPSVAVMDGGEKSDCPSCGSDQVTKQGFKVGLTQRLQQFHCRGCRHWFSRPVRG